MITLQDALSKECAVKVKGIDEKLLVMHKKENSITCLGRCGGPTLYHVPFSRIEKVYEAFFRLIWSKTDEVPTFFKLIWSKTDEVSK